MSKEYSGQFELMFNDSFYDCQSLKTALQSATIIFFTIHENHIENLLNKLKGEWKQANHSPIVNVIVSNPNSLLLNKVKRQLEKEVPKVNVYYHPSPFQHMIVTEDIAYISNETPSLSEQETLNLSAVLSTEKNVINYFFHHMEQCTKDLNSSPLIDTYPFQAMAACEVVRLRNSIDNLLQSLEKMLTTQQRALKRAEDKEISLLTWINNLNQFIKELKSFLQWLKGGPSNTNRFNEEFKELRLSLQDMQDELFELIPFLPATLPLLEDTIRTAGIYPDEMFDRFPGIYDHLLGEEDDLGNDQENYMSVIAQTLFLMQEPTSKSELPYLQLCLLKDAHHYLANTAYILNKLAFYIKIH